MHPIYGYQFSGSIGEQFCALCAWMKICSSNHICRNVFSIDQHKETRKSRKESEQKQTQRMEALGADGSGLGKTVLCSAQTWFQKRSFCGRISSVFKHIKKVHIHPRIRIQLVK